MFAHRSDLSRDPRAANTSARRPHGKDRRSSSTSQKQIPNNTQPTFKNLFVACLPESLNNAQLLELFRAFNPISAVVMMEADTGKSKGHGFVGFNSEDEGRAALFGLSGVQVTAGNMTFAMHITPSKHKGRVPPQASPCIFVRNVPAGTSLESLKSHFQAFGPVVQLITRDDEASQHAGEGGNLQSQQDAAKSAPVPPHRSEMLQLFIKFDSEEVAKAAIEGTHGTVLFPALSTVPVMCKFAHPTTIAQYESASGSGRVVGRGSRAHSMSSSSSSLTRRGESPLIRFNAPPPLQAPPPYDASIVPAATMAQACQHTNPSSPTVGFTPFQPRPTVDPDFIIRTDSIYSQGSDGQQSLVSVGRSGSHSGGGSSNAATPPAARTSRRSSGQQTYRHEPYHSLTGYVTVSSHPNSEEEQE